MTTPAATLRRVLPLLETGGEDARAVAAAFKQYLEHAHEGLTMDVALGLTPKRGGDRWFNLEAIQRRDAAIAELAAVTGATPKALGELIGRYQTSQWRHDAALDAPPERYRNTPKIWLFHILRHGGGKAPSSERQIGKILARHEIGAIGDLTSARISQSDEENQRVEAHGPEQQRVSRRPARQ